MRTSARGLTVAAAALAALVPWPPQVSLLLSHHLYPALQAFLTTLSNRTSVPVAEAVGGSALLVWLLWSRACWRAVPRRAGRWAVVCLVAASAVYLWFLLVWGHHYRAPALETTLAGFDATRVTPAAVRELTEVAVRQANRWHAEAHAVGFPAAAEVPPSLVASWHRVEVQLGRPRPSVPSTPKRPWMAPYFRAVGISGLLAPFFLETYLSPDLTPPERPAVLAHEWAHLSGYAREEDASFVGVLTAMGADVPSRYSAWLMLVTEGAASLHPVTRAMVLASLAEGPRRDLQAVADRQRARVAWLDRAAWSAYDRALRSQGATEGVAGYGRVVVLLIGSGRLSVQTERETP
jgi:hypothetical protein